MTKKTKTLMHHAYTTAAEMIRQQCELGGLEPEDIGMESEEDIELYKKACYKVHDKLMKLSEKYIV